MAWLDELNELRGKIRKLWNAGFLVDPSEYMPRNSGSNARVNDEVLESMRNSAGPNEGVRKTGKEDRSSLN